MSSSWTFLQAAAAVAASFLLVWLSQTRRERLPYPPGPPPLPILGNLKDIPWEKQWEAYGALGAKYGPIVHLRVLHRHLLIVNDADIASDLLDKRGSVYSGRPPLPMISDLMGWEWNIGFMDYGERWKAHRRVLQRYFGMSVSPQHILIQRKNNRIFLQALLEDPLKFENHIRRSAAANVLTMAYGIDVERHDDPLIAQADEASHSIIAAGLPGSFAVDWARFLKHVPEWVPGARFQRVARESRVLSSGMREAPYAASKQAILEGRAAASLVRDMLGTHNDEQPVAEDLIKNSAGAMYLAAVDTVTATICSFIMAMLRNPEVYEKAREELNRVVGDARLPEYSDRDNTPYLDAAILESCRLYPVAPLGVPHCVAQDDEYRGMKISQGTTVIVNSWAILRDPKRFPQPDAFRPERYLDADGRLDPSAAHPRITMYGWGLRICPGRFFAYSSLWFAAAGMLACFDLQCPVDADGERIVPGEEMLSGLVAIPVPFSCTMKPRSSKHAQLIQAAQEEAD